MLFFIISNTIFVVVDSTLLHGYPGLSSKVFRVGVPNFWHALHELSAIYAIFGITCKNNKAQINNLIYRLFELNLGRMSYKIHVYRARIGSLHIFVIVDDYSRLTWVSFLKQKNEAFHEFSKLCKQLQIY